MTRRRIIQLAVIALLVAAAAASEYAPGPEVLTFALSALALGGLAYVVSLGTEELGTRLPPGRTGLLQSTLGNLPELFVVLFALRDGQLVVAQTSIVGSILANALLVLGITIVVGARRTEDGIMRFGRRLPNDATTLLLLTSFIIVLVGLSLGSGDPASTHVDDISLYAAIVLLLVYGAWVIPYARADTGADSEHSPTMSMRTTVIMLTLGGIGAALVSEWFIGALEPAIKTLGISEAFAGLVIVAIAGNAVENVTAFVLAAKGKSDLAISVVKNSVAQIAAFLFPVLIIVSRLFETHLTFALPAYLIGALGLTAIAVWQVTGDGEAMAFEGWALVGTYVMLAVITLYE